MSEIPKIPEPSSRQIMAIRGYFGWTQTEAAKELAVGKDTLVNMERGNREPHSATLARMGIQLMKLGVVFRDDGSIVLPP